MGTVPFWTEQDVRHGDGIGFWDGCFMGGTALPGIWRLSVEKGRTVEKKKQGGIDGNALQDKGYDGGVLKLKGILWEPEHLSDFEAFLPNIDPATPGSPRNPIDFYHPAAHLLNIFSVYVKKIKVNELTTQILTIEMDIEQWFPKVKPAQPKKDVKGFDGAGTGGATNPADFAVGPPNWP